MKLILDWTDTICLLLFSYNWKDNYEFIGIEDYPKKSLFDFFKCVKSFKNLHNVSAG